MASRVSTGSPCAMRKPTPTMKAADDANEDGKAVRIHTKKSINAMPLQTNNLANLQPNHGSAKATSSRPDFDDMLNRLRMNDGRKVETRGNEHRGSAQNQTITFRNPMLTVDDQPKILRRHDPDQKTESDLGSALEADRSSSSSIYTPATESFDVEVSEIERVKQELDAARSLITRQQQELEETRSLKHTLDQAIGTASEPDQFKFDFTVDNIQSSFNASAHPFTSRSNLWSQGDSLFDIPDNNFARMPGRLSIDHFKAGQVIPQSSDTFKQSRDGKSHLPDYATIYGVHRSPLDHNFSAHRVISGGHSPFALAASQAFNDDATPCNQSGPRRSAAHLRLDTNTSNIPAVVETHSPIASFVPSSLGQIDPINVPNNSQQYMPTRPINMAASPFDELSFEVNRGMSSGYVNVGQNQTYITPLEPMNYRRLLDKSVSCDWKYIVDKIVCSNDQQASIFLQQKLKVGTAEQKFEIVESIINQAYPLMINRFGNFLVQRCFEHGTPDQVVAIANAIHGNVTSLSMDPFGCHVVQKAFDSVPESHKADMVRELLRRIPDTVIHRYACHVWQKLFELRWSSEPPQIMVKVNEALRGMWHEVALGETGSLVVQNIFENCIEEEKRPAIEEVINNIDLIAHGQFGNWCIQHLCEHGSPPDKRRVIDHILQNAYSYSIDQYASKVVEKCLKIGGLEFLDRYLDVITTSHPDRPRIPLIDIAGDQYGNYLIQWILMNTHQHQREQVAIHIRKHMVSLRGSKFGSRVAMLCCNPASVTRPGPGALINPYGAPGQPRGQWNRLR